VSSLINGLPHGRGEARRSDIHIEPFEHEMRVRYRVDGAATRSDEAAGEDAGRAQRA